MPCETKISIVIPVFNGAQTISGVVEEILQSLKSYRLEVILVNDGSKDNSHHVCVNIFERHGDIVSYLYLARNFGEHNAVMAGLNIATGDYVIIMDDDFQNPPEEVKKLIEKTITGGFDVVYGYYEKKRHSWMRNLGSRFNNFVANFLLDKPKSLYLSSFKCMNRFIVQQVIKYQGPFPYVDGLILRSTQNIGKALVRHADRKEGKSGYTMKKLIGLWLNMFINFSIYPLRVSIFLGTLFLFLAMAGSVWIIVEKILNPSIPRGITSVLVIIFIFAGIQLLILGLIGEYLGKLFLMNNRTPQYAVRQVFAKSTNANAKV